MTRLPLALTLALTTGCVSKSRYDELQASYLDLGADHAALQAEAAALKDERAQLEAQLAHLAAGDAALAGTYADLLDRLDPLMRTGAVTVHLEGDHMNIVLGDPVSFDFADASLDPESRVAVSFIGGLLRELDGLQVEVQGHTDAVPVADTAPWRDNTALGAARARTVIDALAARGVPRDRMTLASYGATAPAVPVSGASAGNRRVVVALSPADGDIAGAQAFARAAGERGALVVHPGADVSNLARPVVPRRTSATAVVVSAPEPRPDEPVMLHDFTIPVKNGDVVRVETTPDQELRFSYADSTLQMRVFPDEVEDELRELYDEVAGWEFNDGVTGAEIDDEIRDLLVEAIDHDTIILVDGVPVPGDRVDREVGEFWDEVLDAPGQMHLTEDELDDEIEELRERAGEAL